MITHTDALSHTHILHASGMNGEWHKGQPTLLKTPFYFKKSTQFKEQRLFVTPGFSVFFFCCSAVLFGLVCCVLVQKAVSHYLAFVRWWGVNCQIQLRWESDAKCIAHHAHILPACHCKGLNTAETTVHSESLPQYIQLITHYKFLAKILAQCIQISTYALGCFKSMTQTLQSNI